MENQKKKMNWLLFIVLLLVFFPAAVIYALSVVLYKPNAKPKNGYIAKLVFACGALINATIVSCMEDLIVYTGVPLLLYAGMLAVAILGGVKPEKAKLFNIIYIALFVLTLVPVVMFYIYLLGAIMVTPFAIVGIVRAFKYPAAIAKWNAANAANEAVAE